MFRIFILFVSRGENVITLQSENTALEKVPRKNIKFSDSYALSYFENNSN